MIDRVTLSGLNVDLVQDKSGKTNFADLAGAGGSSASAKMPEAKGAPKAAPVAINIAGIEVRSSSASWRDEATGSRYKATIDKLEDRPDRERRARKAHVRRARRGDPAEGGAAGEPGHRLSAELRDAGAGAVVDRPQGDGRRARARRPRRAAQGRHRRLRPAGAAASTSPGSSSPPSRRTGSTRRSRSRSSSSRRTGPRARRSPAR